MKKIMTENDKRLLTSLFFGREQDECMDIIELFNLEESIKNKLAYLTDITDKPDSHDSCVNVRMSGLEIKNRVELLRKINDRL